MSQARPHLTVKDLLDRLPIVEFPSECFPGMQVGSWELLQEQTTRIQHEGVINENPRDVAEFKLVQPRKAYSGIFKIISTFEAPGNIDLTIKGTAFAIDEFIVATSAHIMFDRKLGPAKMAVLCADERSTVYDAHIPCIASAAHTEWMKSYQPENDFCMVAIVQPFKPEVRSLRLELASETASFEAKVVGFPLDLPITSEGSQLIVCQGRAKAYKTKQGVMIRHKANTVGGSSGSPLCNTEEKVLAVHCSFNSEKKENYAVPINMNGNDVSQSKGILRRMRNPQSKLPKATFYLGKATYENFRTQEVLIFGQ